MCFGLRWSNSATAYKPSILPLAAPLGHVRLHQSIRGFLVKTFWIGVTGQALSCPVGASLKRSQVKSHINTFFLSISVCIFICFISEFVTILN
jgi:hypothetical protein